MKNFLKYYIFLILLITSYSYAQSGWFWQHNIPNNTFWDVDFIDSNTGFVVGNGVILKTTNGGNNWINYSVGSNISLYSVSMFNNLKTIVVGHSGIILKTSNNGLNWTKDSLQNIFRLSDVKYLSTDTIIACGLDKTIIKSVDGGITWNNYNDLSTFRSVIFEKMWFTNSNTGFVVSNETTYNPPFLPWGRVLKTTNGGINWITQLEIDSNAFQSVHFLNSQSGYASGWGILYSTTNSGLNWIDNSGLVNGFASQDIFFVNSSTGYNIGRQNVNAVIQYTTNNGINWQNQISIVGGAYAWRFKNADFVSAYTAWAVGTTNIGAVIYKTTNGGIPVGLTPINNNLPNNFLLSQNFPNPFNPETKIKFDVPKASFTKLIIYDLLGREITTLVNEELKPGTYEADWDAAAFSSGVYFYKIITGNPSTGSGQVYSETKKMVLMK